jgi:hypothetical protein
LPSRPGEFHPEPLTDPDLTLSRYPARATARRLPPSVENWSSSCLPVGSLPTSVTYPLRSTGITPASLLLQSSPPLAGASVLSASRLEPLVPFPLPSPARFSRSAREPSRGSRRLYAGCRSGSLMPSPELFPEDGSTPVLTSPNPISTLHRRFACARLSTLPSWTFGPSLTATLTTTAFDRSSLQRLEISP